MLSRGYDPRVSTVDGMPLRNRVTPLGELVADPARGLVYGNRGCLHDAEGRIRRVYQVRRWIACRLEFRGRRRTPLLRPGRFTELFFLDEATAFAAGHRPCAECRRADYDRFADFWRELHGERGADTIDVRLHRERLDPATRERRLHRATIDDLPDGAFVLHDGMPKLVLGDALLPWTVAGYALAEPRPAGTVELVTPPSLTAVLRAGWELEPAAVPFLHPSAGRERRDDAAIPADVGARRRGLWYHSAVASTAQTGFTVWLTGLSGAGKTTIGRAVAAELERRGLHVEVLDGDVVRTHLSKGLGYSREDRDTNIERIGWVASRLTRHGAAVVVAAISPYDATRKRVRGLVSEHGPFVEVWVKAPVEECARRDVKGLYAKAFAGEITQFTGVDDPYEEPDDAEVVADTVALQPEESVALVLAELERLGVVPVAAPTAG